MAQLQSLSINGTDILDYVYPVGSFYITTDNTNSPQTLFGGEWEQIKGRFLWGIDDGESSGSTGGEKEHVLTQDEIPDCPVTATGVNATAGETAQQGIYPIKIAEDIQPNWSVSGMQVVGGGGAHNNMPPYYGVYIYKRVS